MIYLIGQILLCLLLAFLLGLLIGWLLRGLRGDEEEKSPAVDVDGLTREWKMKVADRDKQIVGLKQSLEDCNKKQSAPAAPKTAPLASAGTPDDLKKIWGIGPFLEKKLNGLGITTFKQIADLSEADTVELSEKLEFFPDRIRRDGWVSQAADLHKKKQGK